MDLSVFKHLGLQIEIAKKNILFSQYTNDRNECKNESIIARNNYVSLILQK